MLACYETTQSARSGCRSGTIAAIQHLRVVLPPDCERETHVQAELSNITITPYTSVNPLLVLACSPKMMCSPM